jgi:hypothetical protein
MEGHNSARYTHKEMGIICGYINRCKADANPFWSNALIADEQY